MHIINFGVTSEIKMLPNFLTIVFSPLSRIKNPNERATPYIIPITLQETQYLTQEKQKKRNKN